MKYFNINILTHNQIFIKFFYLILVLLLIGMPINSWLKYLVVITLVFGIFFKKFFTQILIVIKLFS